MMTSSSGWSDNTIHTSFNKLGLPSALARSYEQQQGVRRLFQWQEVCLIESGALQGENLVYSAPTSGGKTLVAEIVGWKTVLSRSQRVLMILPYVALVSEKEKQLKKLAQQFEHCLEKENHEGSRNDERITTSVLLNQGDDHSKKRYKLRVQGYHGSHGLNKHYREDFMICTIEKANSIFNSLVLRKRIHELGCVILDETHLLGSGFSGSMLEILISKLLFYSAHQHSSLAMSIQIVALSATMGNVERLAGWLRARYFRTDFRPVPLQEFVKAGSTIYSTRGDKLRELVDDRSRNSKTGDQDGIMALCQEGLQQGQQVIIFCPTKADCPMMCKFAVNMLGHMYLSQDDLVRSSIHSKRMDLIQKMTAMEVMKENEQAFLEAGCFWHHSGLNHELRLVVEDAFRGGIISLLAATSTLAAGVNLPAGRVIIKSLSIGNEKLNIISYKQMVGRAGRTGQAAYGESFLVVKSVQLQEAMALVNQSLPEIQSQLNPSLDGGNSLVKAVIEVVGLEMCNDTVAIQSLLSSTLWHLLHNNLDQTQLICNQVLHFLIDTRVVEYVSSQRLQLTKLGKGILRSSANLDEAVMLYEALMLAQDGLCLDSSLHLLYLITPLDHSLKPDFHQLLRHHDRSKHQGDDSFAEILKAIGVETHYLNKWTINPPSPLELQLCSNLTKALNVCEVSEGHVIRSKGRHKSEWIALCACKRFWAALSLQAIMDGAPYDHIARRFACTFSDLESLHTNLMYTAHKVESFCHEIGWQSMERLVKDFRPQIAIEVPKELRPLMKVSSMTRNIAKALHSFDIKNIEELVATSEDVMLEYLLLSIGFEYQEFTDVDVEFHCSEVDEKLKSVQSEGKDRKGNMKLIKESTRRKHLAHLVRILQSNAREITLKKSIKAISRDLSSGGATEENHVVEEAKQQRSDIDAHSESDQSSEEDSSHATSSAIEDETEEESDEVDPITNDIDGTVMVDTSPEDYRYHAPLTPGSQFASSVLVDEEDEEQRPEFPDPPSKVSRTDYPEAIETKAKAHSKSDSTLNLVKITPYKDCSKVEYCHIISDEDLCRLMDDLENEGVLLHLSASNTEIGANNPSTTAAYYVPVDKLDSEGTDEAGTSLSEHGVLQIEFKQIFVQGVTGSCISYQQPERSTYVETVQQPQNEVNSSNSSQSYVELSDEEILEIMLQWEKENSHSVANNIQIEAQQSAEKGPGKDTALFTDSNVIIATHGDNGSKQSFQSANIESISDEAQLEVVEDCANFKRKRSPYLTPFTASKFRSPGTYLYYELDATPNQQSEDDMAIDERNSLIGKFPDMASYLSVPLHERRLNRLLTVDDAIHFQRLRSCTSNVAFELVYKPIPSHFLINYPRGSAQKDGLKSWSSLLSYFCSPRYCVTHDISDAWLPNVNEFPVTIGKERTSSMYALVGVVLCFQQSDQDYFLRLPTVLPLWPALGIEEVSQRTSSSGIDSLSMSIKRAICAWVGFESIVHKARGMYKKMGSGSDSSLDSWRYRSNPLFSVSRSWCWLCRFSLVEEWRSGICLEWRVLQSIMKEERLTKIATDMKRKLVLLREREVMVRGSLQDPAIAFQLLKHAGENWDDKQPLFRVRGLIGEQAAHQRAWRSAQVMAELQLLIDKTQLTEVFEKIEMPLLYSVAEAEFSGIEINGALLDNARELLQDRIKLIRKWFNRIVNPQYDLDSSQQASQLKAQLHGMAVDALERRLKEQGLIYSSVSSHSSQVGLSALALGTPNSFSRSVLDAAAMSCPATALDSEQKDLLIRQAIFSHPLTALRHEYHSHIRTLPMIHSLMSGRKFSRVRCSYASLGTETGRLIATQPPLQHISKLCSYLPFTRLSLLEELKLWENRWNPLIRVVTSMNNNLLVQAGKGQVEWVKFIPRRKSGAVQETLSSFSSAIASSSVAKESESASSIQSVLLQRLSLGKLRVLILMNQCPDHPTWPHRSSISVSIMQNILSAVQTSAPHDRGSLYPLFEQWIRCSSDSSSSYSKRYHHQAEKQSAGPTLQVFAIVEFGDSHQLDLIHCSRLQRLHSSLHPSQQEEAMLNDCLTREWFDKFFRTAVSPSSFSSGSLPASTMAVSAYSQLVCSFSLRDSVRASRGFLLLAADYSQIELRLLAHFSQDPQLMQAFHGQDVFKTLAASWLGHGQTERVSAEERALTKQLCYAMIYGAGTAFLAEQAQLTRSQARQRLESFLSCFPVAASFIQAHGRRCLSSGRCRTLLGRQRRFCRGGATVESQDPSSRSKIQRQAINTLCQGSAADLVKLAMINIRFRLKQLSSLSYQPTVTRPGAGLYRGLDDVRLILQMHDELVFEVRQDDIVTVGKIVKECMETAVELTVPLEVKLSCGDRWGALQPYTVEAELGGITLIKGPLAKNLFGRET